MSLVVGIQFKAKRTGARAFPSRFHFVRGETRFVGRLLRQPTGRNGIIKTEMTPGGNYTNVLSEAEETATSARSVLSVYRHTVKARLLLICILIRGVHASRIMHRIPSEHRRRSCSREERKKRPAPPKFRNGKDINCASGTFPRGEIFRKLYCYSPEI